MNKTQILSFWQNMPWNEIKTKSNKHLPKFVFIVLIVLLAQTFAKLTWAFFSPAQASVSNNLPRPATKIKAQVATSLQNIADYHLFGDAKKTVITQQKVIDAPETRLRLNLKGVFASTNTTQALAIISSSKGKDTSYHIGEKITAGVLLHAVYADRVILKRGGKLETLRLPKHKLDSKAVAVQSTVSKNSSRPSSQPSRFVESNQAGTRHLKNMRDTLLKDPAKLWQQVRINPVMKNGQVHGYTMMHNDKAVMKALKLTKTDIVTSINGQSLSDPATLYGLMSSLSTQQSLELGIERNGQQKTIQLSF